MMWIKIAVSLSFLAVTWTAGAAGKLTPEQLDARDTGIKLYNQHRFSEPELRIAAEAGDPEAQYYLGEAIRKHQRYMTREAQKWLEASANQGYTYAMVRLSRSGGDLCAVMSNCPQGRKTPDEWLKRAHDVTLPLAEQGDPEAMLLMYEISFDTKWRTRAAEAGHALAQYWEAVSIKEGEGFYLFRSRKQDIEKWFKASAEGGYPKSMQYYQAILAERGNWEAVRHWHLKAAEVGDAGGTYTLGSYLAHEPKDFAYELDLIKGYGLLSLVQKLDGGGNLARFAGEKLNLISAKMTPEQIKQALEFAEEWKAAHPPLSYFPDKLSTY